MEGSAWLDPKGRVVVFDSGGHTEVYAVPGHWDGDDIDRFIDQMSEHWERATVTNVKEVETP